MALVHDYLREFGGAERVLIALHEIYPQAPVFTAFYDQAALGKHAIHFKDWDIKESWLTKIPGYKKLYSPLRVFAPNYFAAFDLSEYDLVISSSNMYFAKAVKVRADATHLSYCHTPARSLYGYTTMTDWHKNPLIKFGGTLINHYLRIVDFKVAQRVQYFIANSQEVKNRIKKFYRRDAVVIYPPVDVPTKMPGGEYGDYFLYIGRLAYSKHVDLAVEACKNAGVKLKVAGTGKLLTKLQEMGGAQIEFLGSVSDEELAKIYAGAKAVIFPAEDEDFGIVPVEAMGYGIPVIAHNSGGPKETVIDGKTGVLFNNLTTADIERAIVKINQTKWSKKSIWQHAQKFNTERFKTEITDLVASIAQH